MPQKEARADFKKKIISKGEYQLPFQPNKKIKRRTASVHKKYGNPHAIDWAMPIGTSVLAARDGKVVKTESDYSCRR